MSKDDKADPYYLARGKEVVDMLYDKGYLDNQLNRESMTDLDEFIGFLMQMYAESAVKVDRLTRKIKAVADAAHAEADGEKVEGND